MVSFGQKLCNGIARFVQKPTLMVPLPQPVARKIFDFNAWVLYRTPGDMTVQPDDIGGVPGAWIGRQGQAENGVMLYLHGGGFVIGSLRSHRHLVAHLAAEAGLKAYFVDYRLAPEHPFPAAPDDALAAYRGLLDAGHDAAKIALAGDSAGGNLVAVLLQDIARLGLPMPAVAALISPVTDLGATGQSFEENRKRDLILPEVWARRALAAYLDGQDTSNPRISPLLGDLTGLPPMIIQVCEGEMLRDDGIRLAEGVTAAGGVAALSVWADVPHVWHLMCGRVAEADQGVTEIANFLKKYISG